MSVVMFVYIDGFKMNGNRFQGRIFVILFQIYMSFIKQV